MQKTYGIPIHLPPKNYPANVGMPTPYVFRIWASGCPPGEDVIGHFCRGKDKPSEATWTWVPLPQMVQKTGEKGNPVMLDGCVFPQKKNNALRIQRRDGRHCGGQQCPTPQRVWVTYPAFLLVQAQVVFIRKLDMVIFANNKLLQHTESIGQVLPRIPRNRSLLRSNETWPSINRQAATAIYCQRWLARPSEGRGAKPITWPNCCSKCCPVKGIPVGFSTTKEGGLGSLQTSKRFKKLWRL